MTTVKFPKCPFSTLELLPFDNYRPVTIFWTCPKVVTISDNFCSRLGFVPKRNCVSWGIWAHLEEWEEERKEGGTLSQIREKNCRMDGRFPPHSFLPSFPPSFRVVPELLDLGNKAGRAWQLWLPHKLLM